MNQLIFIILLILLLNNSHYLLKVTFLKKIIVKYYKLFQLYAILPTETIILSNEYKIYQNKNL